MLNDVILIMPMKVSSKVSFLCSDTAILSLETAPRRPVCRCAEGLRLLPLLLFAGSLLQVMREVPLPVLSSFCTL